MDMQPLKTAPLLPVYRRSDLTMVRGEGVYLYDERGRGYLDFAAGIAVNSLGHCHPHLVKALQTQAATLWHCSNLYQQPELVRYAERLTLSSFADKVFFCNSGAEAVECGLKMIRKYQHAIGRPERYRVITLEGSFHGRTLATISAGGGSEVGRKGYAPLMDGFDRAPFGDLAAMEAAISEYTGGILVEPIQGEGGVRPLSDEYLRGLRQLADKHGLLLFFDEVQCGMGRTGTLFAYELSGVIPDIVSVAKGIGSGFPLAACLATEKAAQGMTQGSHGSTYGGNPLAMAVGNAVLDVMLKPGFFMQVNHIAALLKQELESLAKDYPALIEEVRGVGLMLGLVMRVDSGAFTARLREAGLLTALSVSGVIRIVPPLIIKQEHIKEAMTIMRQLCKDWQ